MKKTYLTFLFLFTLQLLQAQDIKTPYEKSKGNYTATYQEIISYYQSLAKKYKKIKIKEIGTTDIGKPLHLISISTSGKEKKEKVNILINNGIHPGEPEGIDASMMLARDLVAKPENQKLLDKVNIFIIPVYNVDGCLNRGSYSRANENGPESYGFRGNAKNLDLNRDFIKCDSKNAISFQKIFHETEPQIFIDTHTSDGADYSYTSTYISTQKDKLQKDLATLMWQEINPLLDQKMKAEGIENCPYVNTFKEIPDSGIVGFYESPRFSTGYAALFNCMGYVVETHMLKKFDLRVSATYSFLKNIISIAAEKQANIILAKKKADMDLLQKNDFPLNWKLDSSSYEIIDFKGFEASTKKSVVSNLPVLFYDRSKPYDKKIKFYNNYLPLNTVQKPSYYIIPAAWRKVINLMVKNNIKVQLLCADTTLTVDAYYIDKYKTIQRPYESHYLHYNVKVKKKQIQYKFYKNDYVISTAQPGVRYIIETLEPEAVDSYFAWNFFDGILMQKEYFSDYVFEDIAAELLQKDPDLRTKLNAYISENPEVKNNSQEQLDFIYRHSPYFESSYLRYPVYRFEEKNLTNLKYSQ